MRSLLCVTLLCGLCTGCLHYSLHGPDPLPFHSIVVAPVESPSWTNLTQDLLYRELLQKIATCPSLHLVYAVDAADVILEVVLVDFSQNVISTEVDDPCRATSYNLCLEAQCTLKDSRNGKEYCRDRTVVATVPCLAGLHSIANRQDALPELVRELSLRICNLVLGPW